MEPTRNLSQFLHNSGSIYHINLDMVGNYIYANNLYNKIFLGSSEASAKENFQASVYSEDLELFNAAKEECISHPGRPVTVELRKTRKDGSFFWIRWEFCTLTEKEQVTGLQAFGADVTETKRAEREKEEVQQKLTSERYLLRTLIDHLPDYIYVKDLESKYVITNKAKMHLLGAKTEDEMIGRTIIDYVDTDSAKGHQQYDKSLIEGGRPVYDKEETVINKLGEKKCLLTTRVPLKREDGKLMGFVAISRDITERKKIEESLRISVERYNIMSKATNDAIWDWDLYGNTMLWNDAVVPLFGYSHEEILKDKTWWENHVHPDDRERVVTGIYKHIEEGIESWKDEYRFLCSDGTYKTVLDRGYILFNEENKPYRMIGAMMDLTERKKLQAEIVANNISRQRQITEAAIMAQERERAEIGRELHDNINQILTTTKMYLDMALTEKDISEELTLKSHENISTAIEEIRILSKSLVPPSLGDIGLKEAVAEMINNLKFSQKIDIKLKTTGFSKSSIPGNIQLMVFRIVQEQMNNILKHARATNAEIKMSVTRDALNISVIDNGIGFDVKKRMKGIGLMNIMSRAEVHNGDVDIISSPGNGCTLKISIPI